jgi:hypothetical protein
VLQDFQQPDYLYKEVSPVSYGDIGKLASNCLRRCRAVPHCLSILRNGASNGWPVALLKPITINSVGKILSEDHSVFSVIIIVAELSSNWISLMAKEKTTRHFMPS